MQFPIGGTSIKTESAMHTFSEILLPRSVRHVAHALLRAVSRLVSTPARARKNLNLAIEASPVKQTLRIKHFLHLCHHRKVQARLILKRRRSVVCVNHPGCGASDEGSVECRSNSRHF